MPYDNYYSPKNVYAFVNGLEGAKSFIVPPNQTMLLMDSEQPVCYMKTANVLGQGTLRYFKLLEVTEADIRNGQNVQQQTDFGNMLDKNDDFVQLKARVDELEKKLGDKNE